MNSLEGKIAMVTGAASKRGMGRAIALRLASEGANIAILDKFAAPQSLYPGDENWGGLSEVADEIKSSGRDALPVVADISNSEEVNDAVNKTIEKFGKIDILINCAGIRGPVGIPVVELSEEDWKNIFATNSTGAFLISKAVARSMIHKGGGGKIIHIASIVGKQDFGVPGSAAYCASKHALLGLVRTLALELSQYGINVNAINPGAFITNLRDETCAKMGREQDIPMEEARKRDNQKMVSSIPLGRLGIPDEVAELALFLVSDHSSYITGEAVSISGGV